MMALGQEPTAGSSQQGESRPHYLQPAPSEGELVRAGGGSGTGPGDAGTIVNALRDSANLEFQIAERLSSKARQAFALAAAIFAVSQTVAFGSFEAQNLSQSEKNWMIALAIAAVAALGVAAFATAKADSTFASRDLPLKALEDDLNAAYAGDDDVLGRLGSYFLGVVRTRREANDRRRFWYKLARLAVALALLTTMAELIVSLIGRVN